MWEAVDKFWAVFIRPLVHYGAAIITATVLMLYVSTTFVDVSWSWSWPLWLHKAKETPITHVSTANHLGHHPWLCKTNHYCMLGVIYPVATFLSAVSQDNGLNTLPNQFRPLSSSRRVISRPWWLGIVTSLSNDLGIIDGSIHEHNCIQRTVSASVSICKATFSWGLDRGLPGEGREQIGICELQDKLTAT